MKRKALILFSILIILAGLVATGIAMAGGLSSPLSRAETIHPQFALLDANQQNVLESAKPVSTMNTCGQCHDTEFIANHSFHTDLGLSSFGTGTAHTWDQSNGLFGQWNPLTYRYLSTQGDDRVDLDTASWLMTFAARVVGGGPATTDPSGESLLTSDPTTQDWDWQQSGVYEIDCFLCHFESPNSKARIQAIQSGNFQWADTATLVGTGLVDVTNNTYTWNASAFTKDGKLRQEFVQVQDPTNDNCAQCHGAVHTTADPLVLTGCSLDSWDTATTGQVISGQKISNSGMNLLDKQSLTRSFDIHAERGLKCTDCHYSVNNPAYSQPGKNPEYLSYDPRRIDIGEYLLKPDHNFARGGSATTTDAKASSMRLCSDCHYAQGTHDWLPYAGKHMQVLTCESCHIPSLYAPAAQSYNWTTLTPGGQALSTCRGTLGNRGSINDLVSGYTPLLMPHTDASGEASLAPYNLITSWYWVYDGNNGTRPVRLEDLKQAFFGASGSAYVPQVIAALDTDQDGSLGENELVLDTLEKQSAIASRLTALGLNNPRIVAEVQPYRVSHSVTSGDFAIKDCKACHSGTSRLTLPIKLSDNIPGGVMPQFINGDNVIANGKLYQENGALYYTPVTKDNQLYVFGHDRVPWIDLLGTVFFLGVLGSVTIHGSLRYYTALKSKPGIEATQKVYMYSVYERFWHWLQTLAIVLLLLTGLVIHNPDLFRLFSFPHIVVMHNIVAVLLVINALFSLFYHLVSGEIRQYLPHPYGFFDQAIVQAKYYLKGIFKGAGHPYEKTPGKKLNPLQQITYFSILNLLLPLQIITGALMWGMAQFSWMSGWLGGQTVVAPFHSLVAWLFASFIVGHVYLTTTGTRPLTSINAMMLGWDDVEVHQAPAEAPEAQL